MNEELKKIYRAFDGKLIGNLRMKTFVCEVVSRLPAETQTYVTRTCWFIGSMEDAWAFAFTGNDLKDQHLVFLSDELLAQSEQQIYYSIAHEIGHVVLQHRNSVLVQQTKAEIARQETEADVFAKQYAEEVLYAE
jgi:Zn-dependent protease with chaperone function